jgi:metallophosphoesterase (TIGR03767 family)
VLKALAAATAGAATGVGAFPARSARAAGPVRAAGTTLDSTVVPGPVVNGGGYRRLVSGPGEPHVVRDDLGVAAGAARAANRRPVLAFAHLTDMHVIDAQSPARVEFLDRFDDDAATRTIFSSAYRPQEFLSPHLADRVVAGVRAVGVGPVTGTRLAFALCTGDNTDNAQLNELQWQLALMNGTPFTPNSGGPSFEGVGDGDRLSYDVHYWHPGGTPDGAAADDNARRLYGFPTLPGLLDAAIAQFTPAGIGLPWYSCYGNHDGLVQGNFPSTLQLGTLATGPLKVVQPPTGLSQDDLLRGDPTALTSALSAPARVVTADADRRVLSRTESVQEHFTTGGLPLGHGFTAENVATGTAYYTFDASPVVRGIVLDTVNPNGESSGSLDAAQFAWLRARLEESVGRLVVLFSHHTLSTMTNRIPVGSADPRDHGPRVLGPEVEALLLQFRNVVLWVNGHTHVNRITPHAREGGGGFWEVNTAAHVDFPCQARLVELVDNRDGTLSVFATVVDAEAPLLGPSQVGPGTSSRELGALGRELALNDWQARGDDRRGDVADRNVELLVAAPFDLSAPPAAAPQPAARPTVAPPAGRSLPATGAVPAVAAGALGLAAAGALAARAARDDA